MQAGRRQKPRGFLCVQFCRTKRKFILDPALQGRLGAPLGNDSCRSVTLPTIQFQMEISTTNGDEHSYGIKLGQGFGQTKLQHITKCPKIVKVSQNLAGC